MNGRICFFLIFLLFYLHRNLFSSKNGANFFPQIGGWNFIGMQIFVASLFYIIAIPISIYLRFKNFEIYKKDYMNLIIGIFADTYIVAFFNMILQLIIDVIYDFAKDRITLKRTAFNLKTKRCSRLCWSSYYSNYGIYPLF